MQAGNEKTNEGGKGGASAGQRCGRAASGGVLAPEPPHATEVGPLARIVSPFFPQGRGTAPTGLDHEENEGSPFPIKLNKCINSSFHLF